MLDEHIEAIVGERESEDRGAQSGAAGCAYLIWMVGLIAIFGYLIYNNQQILNDQDKIIATNDALLEQYKGYGADPAPTFGPTNYDLPNQYGELPVTREPHGITNQNWVDCYPSPYKPLTSAEALSNWATFEACLEERGIPDV